MTHKRDYKFNESPFLKRINLPQHSEESVSSLKQLFSPKMLMLVLNHFCKASRRLIIEMGIFVFQRGGKQGFGRFCILSITTISVCLKGLPVE